MRLLAAEHRHRCPVAQYRTWLHPVPGPLRNLPGYHSDGIRAELRRCRLRRGDRSEPDPSGKHGSGPGIIYSKRLRLDLNVRFYLVYSKKLTLLRQLFLLVPAKKTTCLTGGSEFGFSLDKKPPMLQ